MRTTSEIRELCPECRSRRQHVHIKPVDVVLRAVVIFVCLGGVSMALFGDRLSTTAVIAVIVGSALVGYIGGGLFGATRDTLRERRLSRQ